MFETRSGRLATFFTLYIAQTIPMSFISTVIPVLMRESNFSLIEISMMQLVKLPWIVKFMWSPLVDRYSSSVAHYKRWIITSELVYALLIGAVVFLDYQINFYVMLPLIIAAFVASATQDIATDALAVLSFNREEKSLVNSMQSMGSFAGTLVGGGLLLMAYKSMGWSFMMAMLALFVVVAIIPISLFKGEGVVVDRTQHRAEKKDIIRFFTQKGVWRQIIFLLLFYSGLIGTLAMLKPWLVDLGYTMEEIGVMSGIFGTAVGLGCSFISGLVVKRISRYWARVGVAVFILLVTLYFVFVAHTQPTTPMLYGAVFMLWGAYGAASVVVYTCAMDQVRIAREGTDFTLQTVITHFSGIVLAIASGHIAQWLGYEGLTIFEASLAAISLLYVTFAMKDKPLKHETHR